MISLHFNFYAAGYSSPLNSLNANTVAERDYLRSEGDPGAAGYTIKEAVALTRSMVSSSLPCYRCYTIRISCPDFYRVFTVFGI